MTLKKCLLYSLASALVLVSKEAFQQKELIFCLLFGGGAILQHLNEKWRTLNEQLWDLLHEFTGELGLPIDIQMMKSMLVNVKHRSTLDDRNNDCDYKESHQSLKRSHQTISLLLLWF